MCLLSILLMLSGQILQMSSFFATFFLKNFKDLWAYPCFILIIMYFYTKIHYIYVIRRFFHIVS